MSQFDVLTVGNAIVDIISRTEDDFLVREDIIKGAMNLIDADRAEHLYSVMGPAIEASGGSAANTAVGVASEATGGPSRLRSCAGSTEQCQGDAPDSCAARCHD